MKKLLSLVLFIPFVSFLQDIDLNKAPKKEKKVLGPLEFNVNYGLFYNFSDSITRMEYKVDYYGQYYDSTKFSSMVLDSTMVKNSFSFGLRKQYGKFRVGIDFSHVTSSDKIDDYLKDFILSISNSNLAQNYVYESSIASNKMNSSRFKLNLDYVFYNKNKSLMHFGLGIGYSKTILKNYRSNQYSMTLFDKITGEELEITYFARKQSVNYLNESMFLSPSFGFEYNLTSQFKVNTNISLFIPLNNILSRSGNSYSYSEAGVPFNGVYESQTELGNIYYTIEGVKKEMIHRFKNPIQIGLNIGIIYALGKKNKQRPQ